MYLRELSGTEGEITCSAVPGAIIGTIRRYSLKRRETAGPDLGLFTFRAALSYLNVGLYNREQLEKTVTITIGRSASGQKRQFRVEMSPDGRTELEEMTLLIEGAKLCPSK